MSTLVTIIAAIVVLAAAVLIVAALRPNTFRVQRTASIKAPPEKIFPLINDLHRFNSWNPYEKMDPQIKGSYSGASAGKGAAYAWESTKVGTGRMEIVDTAPPSKVVMKLDFLKPFEGHNTAEFTLEPQAEATIVTWAMYGPAGFVPKLMGLFIGMDTMIGKSFESGLANLKAAAEN
jgi:uncharacterized protein YndB with AHSA1/START domain